MFRTSCFHGTPGQIKESGVGAGGLARVLPCWWKHDMERRRVEAEGSLTAGPASGMCASV